LAKTFDYLLGTEQNYEPRNSLPEGECWRNSDLGLHFPVAHSRLYCHETIILMTHPNILFEMQL